MKNTNSHVSEKDRMKNYCKLGQVDLLKKAVKKTPKDEVEELLNTPISKTEGTLLIQAILAQQVQVVEYLCNVPAINLELECQLELFYPTYIKEMSTPLCTACMTGNIDILACILRHGVDVNHAPGKLTPLMHAIKSGSGPEGALMLIKHGAKVNEVKGGLTPIHLACMVLDDTELVKALIEKGADVNATNNAGETPVFASCLKANNVVAEMLLNDKYCTVSPYQKKKLLLLLGAKCSHVLEEPALAFKYWRMAFEEHSSAISDGSYVISPNTSCSSISTILKGPKKITCERDLLELESQGNIEDTENQIQIQSLLILEDILGISHPATHPHLLRVAEIYGTKSSKGIHIGIQLVLHVIEKALQPCDQRNQSNNAELSCSNKVDTSDGYNIEFATNCLSELVQIIMNHFTQKTKDFLDESSEIVPLLIQCLENIEVLARKYFDSNPTAGNRKILHDIVGNVWEFVEFFMAILGVLSKLNITSDKDLTLIKMRISKFFSLRQYTMAAKGSLEFYAMKICVFNGLCARSSLYFYQEAVYPNLSVLAWLIDAGINIDCLEYATWSTPILESLQGSQPDPYIVKYLLQHGAHIDTIDSHNESAERVLNKLLFRYLGVTTSNFMTLKCLTAKCIVKHDIPLGHGQIPKTLEHFVNLHGHYSREEGRERLTLTTNM